MSSGYAASRENAITKLKVIGLRDGFRTNLSQEDYLQERLIGHCAAVATASPGQNPHEALTLWSLCSIGGHLSGIARCIKAFL